MGRLPILGHPPPGTGHLSYPRYALRFVLAERAIEEDRTLFYTGPRFFGLTLRRRPRTGGLKIVCLYFMNFF
ncbi:hypothetical protein M6B38_343555 [Iris pallida]|uniref:Uncharacterized protein n=1 Tax=Iris pallida TaxID=29817 RepID=A0AAX6GT71_IRIPA|nr:hypothetical protein M6B38_343555 [Iris pallida]